jgi:hypothetical protein
MSLSTRVGELMTHGAEEFDPVIAEEGATIFKAMGNAYTLALVEEREAAHAADAGLRRLPGPAHPRPRDRQAGRV